MNSALGLDTSVVLRLLIGQPPDQAERALRMIETHVAEGSAIHISDLVIVEAYYALHAHYGVPKKEAIKALRSLLESEQFQGSAQALEVLAHVAPNKPGFVDRLIHAQYSARGASLVTFEKAGSRLPGTMVL